jgi:hypothetical protein
MIHKILCGFLFGVRRGNGASGGPHSGLASERHAVRRQHSDFMESRPEK